jgi:Cu(I)/Ag(I) efflux system membrane fusion protein
MRWISLTILALAAVAASYLLGRQQPHSAAATSRGRRVLYYVDPMHPGYKSDKPGLALDCGMELEPVYAGDGKLPALPAADTTAGAVSIDGPRQRLLGIRVAAVEKSASTRAIRVIGRVVPEDTRVYKINTGVDGFVRETYHDSVGTRVEKDQKLASYFGPDFLAAASGFLAASERVPGSVGRDGARSTPGFPGVIAKEGVKSIQGYADRLRNLGMSDVQIKHIAESRELPQSIDVVSPAPGFIVARNISPGQHFERGMEFYRVADLSRVWVEAEVYEQEAAHVRPGSGAAIALRDEGRRLPARISDSLPQSEAGGGTVKIRLEADNSGFLLRPERLVDVELQVRLPEAITVPLDALVDSGAGARVYVERGEGRFEPREVETGWRFGERAEVRRGLKPGERVVIAATFLVDSESRLKAPAAESPVVAIAEPQVGSRPDKPQVPAKDPSCGMPVDPARAAASGNSVTSHGATYYFCSKQCKQKFQNDPALSASRNQAAAND